MTVLLSQLLPLAPPWLCMGDTLWLRASSIGPLCPFFLERSTPLPPPLLLFFQQASSFLGGFPF